MSVDISTDLLLIDNLLSGTYTDSVTSTVTTLTSCIQKLPIVNNQGVHEGVMISGVQGSFAIPRNKLSAVPTINSKLVVAGISWRVLVVDLRVLNGTYICGCQIEGDETLE